MHRSIHDLIFPSNAEKEDIQRWYNQGFVFNNERNAMFGLVQSSGGPCGLLAIVQGYIIADLFFNKHSGEEEWDIKMNDYVRQFDVLSDLRRKREEKEEAINNESEIDKAIRLSMTPDVEDKIEVEEINEEEESALKKIDDQNPFCVGDKRRDEALIKSLAQIIWQSRIGADVTIVTISSLDEMPFSDVVDEMIVSCKVNSYEEALKDVEKKLSFFKSPLGCINLLYSVIQSRGISNIKADMDDNEAKLTGEYGMCAAELMNLLNVGYAASQFHDGSVPVGDSGLFLRGIQKQPLIGYLSFLESLRYVKIGEFLKNPILPIYIIGSSSHYSILFSLDKKLNDQSEGEVLLQQVSRCALSLDVNDSGFIMIDKFPKICYDLGLIKNENFLTPELQGIQKKLSNNGTNDVLLLPDLQAIIVPVLAKKKGISLEYYVEPNAIDISGGGGGEDSNWSCSTCTFVNEINSSKCSICDTARPAAFNLEWKCSKCTFINQPKNEKCELCDNEKGSFPSNDLKFDLYKPKIESKVSKFTLFYYNGIRKKIKGLDRFGNCVKVGVVVNPDEIHVPSREPINDIIRTKWKSSIFDWLENIQKL